MPQDPSEANWRSNVCKSVVAKQLIIHGLSYHFIKLDK
jgi:hypothetical protein